MLIDYNFYIAKDVEVTHRSQKLQKKTTKKSSLPLKVKTSPHIEKDSLFSKSNQKNREIVKDVWIVSVDGGGARGVIPAYLLKKISARYNLDIRKDFQVLAGTSTGGLIVLGLSVPDKDGKAKYSIDDLFNFYTNETGKIFHPRSWWHVLTTLNGFRKPKYLNDGLEKFTQEIFQNVKFSESLGHVVIPALDLLTDDPHLFTDVESKTNPAYNLPMQKLACGTCSYPTAFNPTSAKAENGKEMLLVDGGLFRANPSDAAVRKAKALYPKARVHILSVGTGTCPMMYSRADVVNKGMFTLAKLFFKVPFMTNHEVHAALEQEYDKKYYVRLQCTLDEYAMEMDRTDPKSIQHLIDEAAGILKDRQDDLDVFFQDMKKEINYQIDFKSAAEQIDVESPKKEFIASLSSQLKYYAQRFFHNHPYVLSPMGLFVRDFVTDSF